MEFMESEGLRAFKLMQVVIFKMVNLKKFPIGPTFLLILHLGIAIIQSYYFIVKFQVDYFVKYAPVYFGRIFIFASMMAIIAPKSRKLSDFVLEKFHQMSFKKEKRSIINRIRRESNIVASLCLFNLLLAIFSGFVHMLPNPDDKNIFFTFAFIEENFPQWSTVLSWMYRSTFVYTGLLMPLPIYLAIYSLWQLKFQLYVFIERINEIKRFPNDKMLNIKVKQRLRFCINCHNDLIEFIDKVRDIMDIYVAIMFVTGCVLTICLIFFITSFEGTLQDKYARVIPFLFIVITDTTVCIVTGQLLDDDFERVVTVLQIQPWYKWNRENKKLYLIFYMNAAKSRRVQFSEDMSLNYRIGVKFIKTIYSLMSVLIQMKNS